MTATRYDDPPRPRRGGLVFPAMTPYAACRRRRWPCTPRGRARRSCRVSGLTTTYAVPPQSTRSSRAAAPGRQRAAWRRACVPRRGRPGRGGPAPESPRRDACPARSGRRPRRCRCRAAPASVRAGSASRIREATTPTPTTTPRCASSAATRRPRRSTHPRGRPETGGRRRASRRERVVVDLGPGAAAPPEVYDVSYVVADLDTGEVLAAKSPHAWLRPASTLKTLTALTLMPAARPATGRRRERGARPRPGRAWASSPATATPSAASSTR